MEKLKIAGVMIWWSEGSKSRRDKRWKNAVSYPIEITNTNPDLIKVFLKYLIEIVGVPSNKIKVQIQIHANDNQKELESFWSNQTGIPISMFNKTIIRPVGNKPGKSRGTCKIRCYSKEFYAKIQSDLAEVISEI